MPFDRYTRLRANKTLQLVLMNHRVTQVAPGYNCHLVGPAKPEEGAKYNTGKEAVEQDLR